MAIPKALADAHTAERQVFTRIIDIDIEINLAKRIISYLMYLESIGCNNMVKTLASGDDDNFLFQVCREAERALSTLDQPHFSATHLFSTSPFTFSLASPNFAIDEIFLEREMVAEAVSEIYHGVSSVVFDDILEERGLRGYVIEEQRGNGNENGNGEDKGKGKESGADLVWASGEGNSQHGAPVVPSGGAATDGGECDLDMGGGSGSKLNPNAEEWQPSDPSVEEDSRCLFITFSKGAFPLSRYQIWLFFTRYFGPYVENIQVHQPWAGFALYGLIVFKASFVPTAILNGREEVRFLAFGRTIWCKKYRRNNHLA